MDSRAHRAAGTAHGSLADRLKQSRWLEPVWLAAAWPLGLLFALYSWLVRFTSREQVVHRGEPYAGPAVYVSWHRHMPYLVGFHGRFGRTYMSTQAPYMRCMVAWARLQGAGIVYGTVAQRGRDALEQLQAMLARGGSVALAVDGPAGPAFRVKRGCVELAAAAGVPIIPVAYRSARGLLRLGRWDRQVVVLPFDRVEVTVGPPIWCGRDAGRRTEVEAVAQGLHEVDPDGLALSRARRRSEPSMGTLASE